MTMILENSGGPGSSVTLDPEIIELRNKYLKALEGKPFDEMNTLIQTQLEHESDDTNRLSLLAARVYLLRVRTLELRGQSTENVMPWSEKVETKKEEVKSEAQDKDTDDSNEQEWRRLRMIEAGEVNGVRFPPGIIIDVNKSDGDKLVDSGKAEYIEEKEDNKDSASETDESKDNEKVEKDDPESSSEETVIEDTGKASEEEKPSEDKLPSENSPELSSKNQDDLAELKNSISDEEKEDKESKE